MPSDQSESPKRLLQICNVNNRFPRSALSPQLSPERATKTLLWQTHTNSGLPRSAFSTNDPPHTVTYLVAHNFCTVYVFLSCELYLLLLLILVVVTDHISKPSFRFCYCTRHRAHLEPVVLILVRTENWLQTKLLYVTKR